jgi:biotin carboxyl carrier protein
MNRYTAVVGDAELEVAVEPLGEGRWRVVLPGGRERVLDVRRLPGGSYSLIGNDGEAQEVDVDGQAPELTVHLRDGAVALKLLDARRRLLQQVGTRAPRPASGPQPVRAPMPGKVVKVLVRPGDRIAAGQAVACVEAMKMENEIRAPRAGLVRDVPVREGQVVEAGEPLATVE